MQAQRRSLLKRLFASATSAVGLSSSTNVLAESVPAQEENVVIVPGDTLSDTQQQDVPLYSGITRQGNLLFMQGVGAHFAGDARAHADHILTEMEKMLVKAGSSMQKVLKVTVYLHDINDYKAMNEVYKGRFGPKPPVRTTVSPRAGIPNGSLVEMDCIAYL